ncbi:MAG: hypothetical protein JWP03_1390 [Phycisphaerales bacterium]|jgi:hypothetical protein|nr:hypothetical protein [Phycisphaerales bacterium]
MRRRLFTLLCALSLLLCVRTSSAGQLSLLGCSGPNAWREMTDADIFGSWCAFWVLLLLVPAVYLLARAGHPALAMLHLLLLALHPAWTVSAWHGDCGDFKRFASTLFVVAAAAAVPEAVAVAILFRRPRPWYFQRRRRGSGLCSACGYDLRATPDRCPECGAVPAAKAGNDYNR